MFDTNVLISMVLFPGKQFERILDYVTKNHKLVLSSFVIEELFAVVERKFPEGRKTIDSFLTDLTYDLVYTPYNMPDGLFKIWKGKM